MTTKPCLCGSFSFGTYGPDGSAESFEDYGTDCTQTTTNVFAQGHDAKLVGFLVRAELAEEEIAQVSGGVRHTFSGAVHAAGTVSDALALKAAAQLDAARARLAKKAARKAATEARKSAKAVKAVEPTTREARIKVGRWEYDATIDLATGEATHTRKLGGTRTLALGEYKEV